MAVTFPAQTVAATFATNPTFSHTSPAGTDTLVVMSWGGFDGDEPSAVTYAGAAMTLLVNFEGNGMRVQLYFRVAPASGANNFIVTGAGADGWHTGKTFHGVDQTNPFDSPADTNTATGGSGNSAVTITTVADNMTTEVCSFEEETGTDAQVDPINGSSVEDSDSVADEVEPRGVDSHTDTTGAITVGWTQEDNTAWAILVADILAAAAAAPDDQPRLEDPQAIERLIDVRPY